MAGLPAVALRAKAGPNALRLVLRTQSRSIPYSLFAFRFPLSAFRFPLFPHLSLPALAPDVTLAVL
jgi:hypothetical protein